MIEAKDLIIKSTKIKKCLPLPKCSTVEINSKKNMGIYNSTIGEDEKTIYYETNNVNIKVGSKLEVHYSQINAQKVSCKVRKYALFDKASSIIASLIAVLEIPDYNEINMTTLTIISNGRIFITDRKPTILRQKRGPLIKSRIELINVLKQLRKKVEATKIALS